MKKRLLIVSMITTMLISNLQAYAATGKYLGNIVWTSGKTIHFEADSYYYYNRETTSYIDLYSFSQIVYNYGTLSPTTTEYEAYDSKFNQRLYVTPTDLYPMKPNTWKRDEYYVSDYKWIDSTIFDKNKFVYVSVGAGPEDIGYAGYEAFIYDTYVLKSSFNADKSRTNLSNEAISFYKAAESTTPIIENNSTYIPITMSELEDYEIIQDLIFATDSEFNNIIETSEKVIIDDTIVYQLDGELEVNDLFIKSPTVIKHIDIPEVSIDIAVHTDNQSVVTAEDTWLNMDNISINATDEIPLLILEYSLSAIDNLPRTAQINVNGTIINALQSTIYFDANNNVEKGILKFELPEEYINIDTVLNAELKIDKVMQIQTVPVEITK